MTITEPLVVLLHSARFIPPDVLAFIEALVPPGFRWRALEQGSSRALRLSSFAEADYMFAYPGDPTLDELASAPRLKLFQLLSAGYDWLDLDTFIRCNIAVANNDGSNAVSAAEHAMLLILAMLKQLPLHHQATARGEWLGMSQTMQMRELRGKTVGLIGLGNIAQQLARRLAAFDATVLYTKPTRAPADLETSLAVEYRSFEELLPASDILSLHAPLRADTRHMVDGNALARMRRGSFLVNTARGALVDDAALVRALIDGQLAGAALDAFVVEPIDPDSPLLRLSNVVLTPHIAGVTRDTWVHRMTAAWFNVHQMQSGLPLVSRIV